MTDANVIDRPASVARELRYIAIENLRPSKLNVRRHGAKKLDELVGSIEALGILQSLLVRETDEPGIYEIHAGKRRYLAATKLHAQANPDFDQLPCIIMQPGDDVEAIEASLAENLQRLPMDEMDQYEAFKRLADGGMTGDDIASHFGISTHVVERRLAIARLIPDLRRMYRRGDIDARTIRLLTLATPERQRAWIKLEGDGKAPPSWQLKQWLLGGAQISTKAALFDSALYDETQGGIVRDLFADDPAHDGAFFADPAQFWELQNQAIKERAEAFAENGWPVTIINPDERFQSWDWQPARKADGGQIVIEVQPDGHVEFHKGILPKKSARKAAAATATGDEARSDEPAKPELSGPLNNYCDLIRLAAVKTALAKKPKIALRLMLAHALTSSGHWRAIAEPMTAANDTVADAMTSNADVAAFEAIRDDVAGLLGLDPGASLTGQTDWDGSRLAEIFAALIELSDAEVNRILAAVMAETLMLGSGIVDTIGASLDVTAQWSAEGNDAFFALIRDRDITRAILADVCGADVASAHQTATGKKHKEIARMAIDGKGREKVNDWCPPWLAFPQGQLTDRPLTV